MNDKNIFLGGLLLVTRDGSDVRKHVNQNKGEIRPCVSMCDPIIGDKRVTKKGLTVFTVNPKGQYALRVARSRSKNRFFSNEYIVENYPDVVCFYKGYKILVDTDLESRTEPIPDEFLK